MTATVTEVCPSCAGIGTLRPHEGAMRCARCGGHGRLETPLVESCGCDESIALRDQLADAQQVAELLRVELATLRKTALDGLDDIMRQLKTRDAS